MPIIDEYDSWLVIDNEKLKKALKKMPPHYRKYETICTTTGLGKQQVSDYLQGRRHPNLLNFKKLCLYFQISSDELLGLKYLEEKK